MTDRELQDEIEALRQEFAEYGTKLPLPRKGKAERKARAEQSVEYFGEIYFPHRVRRPSPNTDLVTLEHREMLRLCDIKNIPKLFLAYRGFAKSTWVTIIDTLHKIYFQKFQAGIVGSFDSRTAVNNFTSAIFIEIITNPRLLQDFGELIGNYRWGVADFITKTGIRLAARGMNEMVKGFNNPINGVRLDLFRGDDLQKRESARSPKQVKSLMDWLWEEVYLALREEVDGGSYFDICGTCVDGGTDAMSIMKEDTSRQMLKLAVPMVLDVPSQIIDTRERGEMKSTVLREADNLPQWRSRYEFVRCEEVRRNVGNSIFMAEMQQSPLSAEFKTFRVHQWTQYLQPHGRISAPDWSEQVIIGRADPSFTTGGTRKAIVLLSSDLTLQPIYVRHVFLRQCSNEEFFAALDSIGQQYPCKIRIEENSLKDWLWDDVKAYEDRKGTILPLVPVHVFGNKDLRIKTLESPYQRGVFVFQFGHSDQDILIDEADMYPEGPFKDGLDAWAGAYADLVTEVRSLRDTDEDMPYSTGQFLPIHSSLPLRDIIRIARA